MNIQSALVQFSMSHGGKRVGAGRPLGSKAKRTLQLQEKAQELGVCPAEAMMSNIYWAYEQLAANHTCVELQIKLRDMIRKNAKDLAPYVYPKLSSVALEAQAENEIQVVITK